MVDKVAAYTAPRRAQTWGQCAGEDIDRNEDGRRTESKGRFNRHARGASIGYGDRSIRFGSPDLCVDLCGREAFVKNGRYKNAQTFAASGN